MNIRDIKYKASEVLVQNKKLFNVLLYIGFINILFQFISNIFTGLLGALISIVITVLTVTLTHGAVVSSLKIINNNYELIDEKEDSLYGLTHFKSLFPTYFLYELVLTAVALVSFIIISVFVFIYYSSSFTSFITSTITLFREVNINNLLISDYVTNFSGIFISLFFACFIVIIITTYVSLRLSLFPYIMQKYGYTTKEALKESNRLMKGNVFTLFKLELSFLAVIFSVLFLSVFINMIIESIIPISIIASLIESLITTYLSVYFYEMKLNVSLAIFYEELDYEDRYVDIQDEGIENE